MKKTTILILALSAMAGTAALGQEKPGTQAKPERLTPTEQRFLCLAAKDALSDVQRMRAAIKAEIDDSPEPGFDKLFEMLVVVRMEIAKTETYERRCKAKS